MLRLCYSAVLLLATQVVTSERISPSSGSLDRAPRILYCPYDATVKLASDVSALEITYTSRPQAPIFSEEVSKCYLQIDFSFAKINRTIAINEIEYSSEVLGKGAGKAEATIAWDTDRGPVCSSPCNLKQPILTFTEILHPLNDLP